MNKIMFHASLLRYDKSDLKDQVQLVCKSNSFIPDGGDSLTVSEPKINFDGEGWAADLNGAVLPQQVNCAGG